MFQSTHIADYTGASGTSRETRNNRNRRKQGVVWCNGIIQTDAGTNCSETLKKGDVSSSNGGVSFNSCMARPKLNGKNVENKESSEGTTIQFSSTRWLERATARRLHSLAKATGSFEKGERRYMAHKRST
jgi:hypothetical protein